MKKESERHGKKLMLDPGRQENTTKDKGEEKQGNQNSTKGIEDCWKFRPGLSH